MKCIRLDSGTGVKTCISFHHTFCLRFFCRQRVKIRVKSRYQKQGYRCLKKEAFACQSSMCTMVDYNGGELSRGRKGPQGVERRAESLCCTRSCSRHYPLTSHHLSLRIQPQETDCRGLYRQKTQGSITLKHTGRT